MATKKIRRVANDLWAIHRDASQYAARETKKTMKRLFVVMFILLFAVICIVFAYVLLLLVGESFVSENPFLFWQ